MDIHLLNLVSSSENPIVAFRKKILDPKNTPVHDLFTECNNRLFLAELRDSIQVIRCYTHTGK